MGKEYCNDQTLNDEEAYNIGLGQYVISIETLNDIFANDQELRENTIVVVSNNSKDGVSGIMKHGSQMDSTKNAVYQMADLIFSSKLADRKYF